MPARGDVARPGAHAASNATKMGTKPATGTRPAGDPEGGYRDDSEVNIALNEPADLETPPAADLAEGESRSRRS